MPRARADTGAAREPGRPQSRAGPRQAGREEGGPARRRCPRGTEGAGQDAAGRVTRVTAGAADALGELWPRENQVTAAVVRVRPRSAAKGAQDRAQQVRGRRARPGRGPGPPSPPEERGRRRHRLGEGTRGLPGAVRARPRSGGSGATSPVPRHQMGPTRNHNSQEVRGNSEKSAKSVSLPGNP